jgi:hypothetical protein
VQVPGVRLASLFIEGVALDKRRAGRYVSDFSFGT